MMSMLLALAPVGGSSGSNHFHGWWWVILLVVVFILVLPLARALGRNGGKPRSHDGLR